MNDPRIPIVTPILAALRSRKVLVAIAAVVTSLILSAVPELEPVRGEILTGVTTLALAVIGGIAVEDAAAAGRERGQQPVKPTREEVRELINELLNELPVGEVLEILPADAEKDRG